MLHKGQVQHRLVNYLVKYTVLYLNVPQIDRFLRNLTSATDVSVPTEHYIECFPYKYFL